jgi:hypothetical protein
MMDRDDSNSDVQPDQGQPEGIDDAELPDQGKVPGTPLAEARGALILVCVVLASVALLSIACFIYQFFYRLAYGDHYVGTPIQWPAVLGHLIRGVGLLLVSWRLVQYIRSTEPRTNEFDATFLVRHRVFWKTFASVLLLLMAYAIFQVVYASWQDRVEKEMFFRPEFESGRTSFRKDRIEIRRGFTEPMEGLQRMQKHHSEEHLFVAAEPEITGGDIADATIDISEVFPGAQTVRLHIKFTEGGTRKMEALTKSHQTRPLAVFVDGKLRGTPRVFSIISGEAQLSGVLTLEEAAKIIEKGADR